MTILKSKDVLKRHEDGSTTVERHAIVDGRGRVIVADVVDDAWRQRLVDAFNAHEANNDANDTVDALVQAEAFIRGFEDDELQEGIPDLLAGLRAAIVRERARPDLLTALQLAMPALKWCEKQWASSPQRGEGFNVVDIVRDAIAKAEGR
jgi:hypothetical protein